MKLNGMGRANMPDMRTCQGKQGLGAFGFVVTSFVKAERWMLAIDCYWWKWHSFLRQIHLVSWMGTGSFTSVLGACVLFLQCFVGAWLAFSCTHSGYRVVKGIYIELSYLFVLRPSSCTLEIGVLMMCSWVCASGSAANIMSFLPSIIYLRLLYNSWTENAGRGDNWLFSLRLRHVQSNLKPTKWWQSRTSNYRHAGCGIPILQIATSCSIINIMLHSTLWWRDTRTHTCTQKQFRSLWQVNPVSIFKEAAWERMERLVQHQSGRVIAIET